MAGLAPAPPTLQIEDGQHEADITSYEYPMPEEVSTIQGDYEEDVMFSVYIAIPVGYDDSMPRYFVTWLCQLSFRSYTDWVEELASRGVAVAYIQYPSDVMPPYHDTFELHEEDGMSNHPYHIPRATINAA